MLTITADANSHINSPLNIVRKSEKYKTIDGNMVFPSPEIWAIEKNIFYLLKNSVEKLFEKKYAMKPSYLSFDEYGNPYLGDMLMLVNNVYCLEEFDLDYVLVPSIESLIKINRDNFPAIDRYKNLKKVEWKVNWNE